MRCLLLSAYHAQSHAAWAEGLMAALPEVDWTLLTLPPRYFSWRLRGNSLSWAMLEREVLEADYDVLLASSMTDLSALRGLCPALCRLPTAVYFHENQFAFPGSARQRQSVEPQMLNLYTALAADRVLFNSAYNRDSFLEGADELLRKLPDFSPRQEVMAKLAQSEVLPVGLSAPEPLAPREAGERLSLLWNHRWEYDKGPEQLLAILQACDATALPLDVHLVGQQFRQQPEAFAQIEQLLAASRSLRKGQWGYVEDAAAYRQLLASADVVLSTALHDFQGLSVMEAVAAGCRPLLPARLCYPQWFADDCLYPSSPASPQREGQAVAAILKQWQQQKRQAGLSAPSLSPLYWSSLAPQYRQLLAELAGLRR